jgi:hypothetical protein
MGAGAVLPEQEIYGKAEIPAAATADVLRKSRRVNCELIIFMVFRVGGKLFRIGFVPFQHLFCACSALDLCLFSIGFVLV